MAINYTNVTWFYYVEKEGVVVSELFATKIEAKQVAEKVGGKVRRTRG